MIQIRRSIFETNSSSTHSVCITKNNHTLIPDAACTFSNMYFGWEEKTYRDSLHKAAYLYAAMVSLAKSDQELEKWKNHIFETLEENGIKCTFEPVKHDEYGGKCLGIDHPQELERFVAMVLHNKKRLLRYLFSEESFVVTGNDNSLHRVFIAAPYKHEEYSKGN